MVILAVPVSCLNRRETSYTQRVRIHNKTMHLKQEIYYNLFEETLCVLLCIPRKMLNVGRVNFEIKVM